MPRSRMYPNLSPGAIGIRTDLRGSVDLAKRHGFRGIDVGLDEVQSLGVEKTRDLLASSGIVAGGTGLPVEYRHDDDTFREGVKKLPALAAVAKAIGCVRMTTWVLPGSNELTYHEQSVLLEHRFRECANILKDNGLSLGLEFIGPKTMRSGFVHEFIYTLEGMLELCDAIGTGNMGVLLDCWHWYTSGGTLEAISRLRPEQVVYVHVNDAPAGISIEDQVDNVRRLPMDTGVIDLPGFLRALDRIGYDGPVTAEPFREDLGKMSADEACTLTVDALRKAWNAAELTW